VIASSAAIAEEYDSFTDWARAHGGHTTAGASTTVFGDLLGSFPSGNLSPVGIAYDAVEHGIWIANESGGQLLLIDADAPHGLIRSIDVQGFNLTTDGNQDGVAVIGDHLYVADYQGDQYLADDLIMQIDRVAGTLLGWWFVDGALNPNPSANIDQILGICDAGGGNLWVTDNLGNLHNITLLAGGDWVRNSVQSVPGGGSWAGIDYDTCLEEFFTANFGMGLFAYHTSMPGPPDATAPAIGPEVTGITSNNNGIVWTVGFTDTIIYEHVGIGCVTPVEATTWGAVKGIYR
jgi:hypothetical protein